jgi:regulator of replication initiation timing
MPGAKKLDDDADPDTWLHGLGSVPMKPERIPTAEIVLDDQRIESVDPPVATQRLETAPQEPLHTRKPIAGFLLVAVFLLAANSWLERTRRTELQRSLDAANLGLQELEGTNRILKSELQTARSEDSESVTSLEYGIGKVEPEIGRGVTATASESEIQIKRLSDELASMKAEAQETARTEKDLEAEVQRLRKDLARSIPPADTAPSPRSPLKAISVEEAETAPLRALKVDEAEVSPTYSNGMQLSRVRFSRYETGENTGRWFFTTPDGTQSRLYWSRESATEGAKSLGYR